MVVVMMVVVVVLMCIDDVVPECYLLMWSLLITVGVSSVAASDLWRCLANTDVRRDELSSIYITSCLLSDCAAQCFLAGFCTVLVFDRQSCRCSVSRNPLAGLDGQTLKAANLVTCFYMAGTHAGQRVH